MNKLSLGILLALCVVSLHAQQQKRAVKKVPPTIPSTVFSASGFAEFYQNIQTPTTATTDMNAFELRRVDLGVEHVFSKTVNAFAQIEANGNATASGSEYSLTMKQAYVEVKNILPQMRVVMGMSPTPAVVTSERIWGYRSLQMMPLEKYGMAPSVDNGLAVKGKIDPYGVIAYHVMVANGTGTMTEGDKMKRISASMGLTPMTGFTVEGYVDIANAGNGRYRSSLKGLIGLEDNVYAFGLEGIYGINHHTIAPTYDQSPYAVSVYGWGQIASQLRIVYRGDYYDDDVNAEAAGMRTIEATVGIDYTPVPEVHIVPNFVFSNYTNKNSAAPKVNDGYTARVTAAFSFSSAK